MDNAPHRHDISDKLYALIAPHLPSKKATGAVWQRIIAASSMWLFGSSVPGRRGVTSRLSRATGTVSISVFAAGGIYKA